MERANQPSLREERYMRQRELTGDSYSHASNIQWRQFVAKDYCRDHDGGNLLRNTSDGHRNNPCPLNDTGRLRGG